MIQSSLSETPSSCASACPSSTWKPGGSPVLLANGSELGWAHSPIVPTERMVSSERASAGPIRPGSIRPMTMPTTVERIAFIPFSRFGWMGSLRLQCADIFDDLVDLRVAEGCAERRHRAFLAHLDAILQVVVVSRRIHQLRPLADRAAPVGVTPAAGRSEQRFDIEWRVVRRDGTRVLCHSRHGTCQGAGESRRPPCQNV